MAIEAAESWRCFHCHQVFTDFHAAREHFGRAPTDDPECLQELGRLGPYLLEKSRLLRAAEAQLARQGEALKELADQAEHTALGISAKRNVEAAAQRLVEAAVRARSTLSTEDSHG